MPFNAQCYISLFTSLTKNIQKKLAHVLFQCWLHFAWRSYVYYSSQVFFFIYIQCTLYIVHLIYLDHTNLGKYLSRRKLPKK